MNPKRMIVAAVLSAAVGGISAICGGAGASAMPVGATTAVSAAHHGTDADMTAALADAATSGSATQFIACKLPSGSEYFGQIKQARNEAGGMTIATAVLEQCRVNAHDEEEVVYTATSSPVTLKIASKAQVEVAANSGTDSVISASALPHWVATQPITTDKNASQFVIRLNSDAEITGLHGIFHP